MNSCRIVQKDYSGVSTTKCTTPFSRLTLHFGEGAEV